MDLASVKKYIKEHSPFLDGVIKAAKVAELYYETKNDILNKKMTEDKEINVLRSADNRVCSSFYPLLVDQKAAYAFTYAPLFDTGIEKTDKKIAEVLGNKFPKMCKKLCKNAAHGGIAWIHYWKDSETNEFRYGVLKGEQVIPVVSDDIDETLLGVIRTYRRTGDDGKAYVVYEIWNDKECEAFRREENVDIDNGLSLFDMFSEIDRSTKTSSKTNIYSHGFDRVPFIPFANNDSHTSDLKRIKGLIDTYDKTFNGFANDLEDIQEVIMVLTGYSGTNLSSFLGDLKKYKTIKLDDKESGSVSTLNIEIPVEARKEMLELTRKAIFMQGQGVDPDPQSFGNSSGVALQFLYSLLELKVGDMETEFKAGFDDLVHAICDFYHLSIKHNAIIQTWTRNRIRNDTELAQISRDSVGLISQKTNLKNHPFVEDAEAEIDQIEQENARDNSSDPYGKTKSADDTDPENDES